MKKITYLTLLLALVCTQLQANGRIPKSFADLSFQGVNLYDTANMGLSLRYEPEDDREKLDVYVYTYGYQDLEEGKSPELKKAFDDIMLGIQAMEDRGYYTDVQKPTTGEGTIELSGREQFFYWGGTSYRQTNEERTNSPADAMPRASFYFITVYDGRFIKMRYTVLGGDYAECQAKFFAILEEFEKKFSR